MDRKELRILQILEEIDRDQIPSQRHMAKKLNISLGLVNSFVKRLATKGYFKITNIPRNRVKYIITPKGAAEKTRLTYEYIQTSYRFYQDARRKLRKLFQNLMLQGTRRIVFVGAGDFTEIAYISLQDTTIELVEIVDKAKAGQKFLNRIICDPDRLGALSFDKIFITDLESREKIYEQILEQGLSKDMIVSLE